MWLLSKHNGWISASILTEMTFTKNLLKLTKLLALFDCMNVCERSRTLFPKMHHAAAGSLRSEGVVYRIYLRALKRS